jgi:hypothetical protein
MSHPLSSLSISGFASTIFRLPQANFVITYLCTTPNPLPVLLNNPLHLLGLKVTQIV